MMKGTSQDVGAELGPVRLRERQVEMPSLVHLIRRADRMFGCLLQEDKLLIFLNHPLGIRATPAMVVRQTRGKRALGATFVQLEGLDLLVKLRVFGIHKRPPQRTGRQKSAEGAWFDENKTNTHNRTVGVAYPCGGR